MIGFFANTLEQYSLQEKTLHALFDQFEYSIDKIENFLSQNGDVQDIIKTHYATDHLRWRINKLCRHIASGEK